MATIQNLTTGQRKYEEKRAAKAGLSLDEWLKQKMNKPVAGIVTGGKIDEFFAKIDYAKLKKGYLPDIGFEMRLQGVKAIRVHNVLLDNIQSIPTPNGVEVMGMSSLAGIIFSGLFPTKKLAAAFIKNASNFSMPTFTFEDAGFHTQVSVTGEMFVQVKVRLCEDNSISPHVFKMAA